MLSYLYVPASSVHQVSTLHCVTDQRIDRLQNIHMFLCCQGSLFVSVSLLFELISFFALRCTVTVSGIGNIWNILSEHYFFIKICVPFYI
jgi:hypothetical protein